MTGKLNLEVSSKLLLGTFFPNKNFPGELGYEKTRSVDRITGVQETYVMVEYHTSTNLF